MSRKLLFLSVCLVMLLMTAAASAQWTEEGALVHDIVTYLYDSQGVVPDGTGGIYAFFADNFSGGGTTYVDIYVVRLDARGVLVWPEPVALMVANGYDWIADVCPDGAGGALVAFKTTNVPAGGGLWVQRVTRDGTLLFSGTGTLLAAADYDYVQIEPDGLGGAIVVWEELTGGTDYNLLAQRVSGTGGIQWASGGVSVCNAAGDQWWFDSCSLGDGSVVVAWEDTRDSGTSGIDVYAQRIALDGSMLWPTPGLPVCTEAGGQGGVRLAANPLGGAVLVWNDDRGGTFAIYGQYLAENGTENWMSGGSYITHSDGTSGLDAACYDDGTTAVGWIDPWDASLDRVRVQFVSTAGWTDMIAVAISDSTTYVGSLAVGADGLGGVVVGWQDDSTGQDMVWGQRIVNKAKVWNDGSPVLMSYGAGAVHGPEFAADGQGGLFVVYQRDNLDGWGQFIGPAGDWGLASGEITAVEDVPGDEGGWVRLRCTPSRIEQGSSDLDIEGYNVWRLAENGAKAGDAVPTLAELADGAFVGRTVGDQAAKALGLPDGTWESVGYHSAMGLAEYLFLAPTHTDSSSAGPALETFCVTTHTGLTGVVYASATATGWSVDNLAPDPPKDLGGSADWDAGGVSLDWDGGKSVDDVTGYNVYRGTDNAFPLDPAHLLGTTTYTSYFDDDPPSTPYYKVTAYDRHGNESEAAVLVPMDISGIDAPAAYRNRLAQNHPNPFNPQTTIVYELKKTGPVWLRVHDVSGRLVRTLVAGTVTGRGAHEVTWRGDDDAGRAVATGVYVVRFETAGFSETRRMALVR